MKIQPKIGHSLDYNLNYTNLYKSDRKYKIQTADMNCLPPGISITNISQIINYSAYPLQSFQVLLISFLHPQDLFLLHHSIA